MSKENAEELFPPGRLQMPLTAPLLGSPTPTTKEVPGLSTETTMFVFQLLAMIFHCSRGHHDKGQDNVSAQKSAVVSVLLFPVKRKE